MIICPKCGAENGKRVRSPVKCCRCWYQFERGVIRHDPTEYERLRKAANIKPERKAKSCPSCGALNGQHQKGCKA